MRELLSGKIHKAIIKEADVSYVGSITIDEDLMELADFWEGQKVLVVSNTSGVRLETYVIKGKRGTGDIFINGAAAHLIKKGEEVIIIAFQFSNTPIIPKCILVDENNKFIKYLQGPSDGPTPYNTVKS
jgi:aspartate 1-decarboxylase